MRFHVVALPHTQTSKLHAACAFTTKVLRFCEMMHSLGHEVFHYGAEGSEVVCTEDITIISQEEQELFFGPFDPNKLYDADWTGQAPYWKLTNDRAIAGIIARKQPGDFVCVIMGSLNAPIAEALPDLLTVEYGIGYNGTFSNFRVFESYAHMHKIWGAQGGFDPNGRFYDAVIPNYLNPAEFPFEAKKEDYFLYMGRLVQRKGINIAVEACKRLGARLVIAGQGCIKREGNAIYCQDGEVYEGDNLEYVGVANPEMRAKLYANAKGVFVPTTYIEPFGTVNVEAQMCGTPVITTDFGAFTETVEHGRTGFRCHTLDHFVWSARHVGDLDPHYIRDRAIAKYSMDRVRYQFQEYFSMLSDLYGKGWYEVHDDRQELNWLKEMR